MNATTTGATVGLLSRPATAEKYVDLLALRTGPAALITGPRPARASRSLARSFLDG